MTYPPDYFDDPTQEDITEVTMMKWVIGLALVVVFVWKVFIPWNGSFEIQPHDYQWEAEWVAVAPELAPVARKSLEDGKITRTEHFEFERAVRQLLKDKERQKVEEFAKQVGATQEGFTSKERVAQ